MGFSAGGMVASGALASTGHRRASKLCRADLRCTVCVHGGPAKLPPIYMAWAGDDTLAGGSYR
jgi:hypothetical protein